MKENKEAVAKHGDCGGPFTRCRKLKLNRRARKVMKDRLFKEIKGLE